MNNIRDTKRMLAYVKFQGTDYEYCTTFDELKHKTTIYVLDPHGIQSFKDLNDDIDLKSIYIHLSEERIVERALLRGDKQEEINKRINGERGMFDKFLLNQEYDYIVSSNQTKEEMFKDVDHIMLKLRAIDFI